MIVYRLEYKDGGGPWFHRDGRPRDGVILPKFEIENLGYLFGFDSLDNLIEYKNAHKDEISFIDIKIKKYLVSKAPALEPMWRKVWTAFAKVKELDYWLPLIRKYSVKDLEMSLTN